jgi:hypothetical protein
VVPLDLTKFPPKEKARLWTEAIAKGWRLANLKDVDMP